MVERLPLIEVLLPAREGAAASVTWNGELVEPDEVKVDEEEYLIMKEEDVLAIIE